MKRQPTFLQTLRQERAPFVALVILALGLRIGLLLAAPALAASQSAENHIPDGTNVLASVLCNPLAALQTGSAPDQGNDAPSAPRSGGAHDPAHCICAAGCFHGANIVISGLDPALPFLLTEFSEGARLALANDKSTSRNTSHHSSIRAPPFA